MSDTNTDSEKDIKRKSEVNDKCMYKNCSNGKATGHHLFRFPSVHDPRQQIWINNCGTYLMNTWPSSLIRKSGLCSEHFLERDFSSSLKDRLLKGTNPQPWNNEIVMPSCAVRHCTITRGKLFPFPRDPEVRSKWVVACSREEGELKFDKAGVCQRHFDEECIIPHFTGFKTIRKLKVGSVPTKFLNLKKTFTKRTFNYWSELKKYNEEPPNKVLCSGIPTLEELPENDNVNTGNSTNTSTISASSSAYNDFEEVDMSSIVPKIEPNMCQTIKKENYLPEHYKDLEKINDSLQQQILTMRKEFQNQMKMLIKKNAELQNKLRNSEAELRIAQEVLQNFFTMGQLKRILNPLQNSENWTAEDIASALILRSKGDRAYTYFRNEKKVPLPSDSTLSEWISGFDMQSGVYKSSLQVLKEKGESMTILQKLTVISFDEIWVSSTKTESQEETVTHNSCQFVMARGLLADWTQPVFYSFDENMTADTLYTILNDLYDIGYIVVSVTQNLKPRNLELWKEMDITEKKNFFLHPSDKEYKVFVFADVTHLIKLIRNYFLDSGFIVDGVLLDKTAFQELLELNTGEYNVSSRLTFSHLNFTELESEKVIWAVQLFSWTNSRAFEYFGNEGLLQFQHWKEMSKMIDLINSWFDLLNSSTKIGIRNDTKAYGMDLVTQDEVLYNMSAFTKCMRVWDKDTGKVKPHLQQFQRGILMTNKSLQDLLNYVKVNFIEETFEPSYILSRRLSHDDLENYVAELRAMGVFEDHASPEEVQERLKWALIAKQSEAFCEDRNVTTESDFDFIMDGDSIAELNSIGYKVENNLEEENVEIKYE